jgi:Arylsulfotransferase (ASST)
MTPAPGLTVYHPDKADHGYTLFAPMTGTGACLIDMQGRIVHHWALPYRPGAYGYLLDNGHLLMAGRTGKSPVPFGGAGGTLLELDWDGKVLWEHVEDTVHHDFCRLPNGNTMVLGWEPVPTDMVPHIKGGQPGTEHEGHIWCDYFREITPDQRVVWEWHGYEHLDVETDRICPLDRRHEWTHANTCAVLPDGNVLTSFRLLNTVVIIDRHRGAFSWKWGREELGHQHDPHLLPNGNILLFDNGWHAVHPTPRSRVLEVQPTTDTIVWSYETKPGWKFFSSFISGAQRLPNGNTLICEGMTGRLFEVTSVGEVVWEYVNPFFSDDERFGRNNTVFRAYRYAPDFPGLRGKSLRPEEYTWMNHLYAGR